MPRMPTSLLNDRFASLKLTKAYSNILIHDGARRPPPIAPGAAPKVPALGFQKSEFKLGKLRI